MLNTTVLPAENAIPELNNFNKTIFTKAQNIIDYKINLLVK